MVISMYGSLGPRRVVRRVEEVACALIFVLLSVTKVEELPGPFLFLYCSY